MDKRLFLKSLGQLAIAPAVMNSCSYLQDQDSLALPENSSEADLWPLVRSHYDLKPEYINLESGYYNIIPKPTLRHFQSHVEKINREGAYYMRKHRVQDKDAITAQLADWVGCDPEELAITRNTTESLDLVIAGYPWNKGDEAIFAQQDYGAMQLMFKQVAQRYGMVNRIVSLPNHPESDEEIVSLYESKITSKTRLIMVCHIVNITGQILPVKKICDMAHRHGVEVMVDGAHAVGHFDFKLRDLNCDYYGSSLHKWLATPLGAGLLYVNKKSMPKIWPLLADANTTPDDIHRLNHTGTHPVHTDLAIRNALDYIDWMGLERKEKRLRYLQRYWTSALRGVPNVVVNTPEDPKRSCAIANVGVTTMKPQEMAKQLLEVHQVFTVAIDYANVQGCRITPNVFSTTDELDHFIEAVKTLAQA